LTRRNGPRRITDVDKLHRLLCGQIPIERDLPLTQWTGAVIKHGE